MTGVVAGNRATGMTHFTESGTASVGNSMGNQWGLTAAAAHPSWMQAHRGLIIMGSTIGGFALGATLGATIGPRLFGGGGDIGNKISLAMMGAAVLGFGGGLLGWAVAGNPPAPAPTPVPHQPQDAGPAPWGRESDNPAPTIPSSPSTERIPDTVTGTKEPGAAESTAPFALKTLTDKLSAPVQVTHAPGDPALYVVQQGGQILRLDTTDPSKAKTFVDLSGVISAGGERGLLSVAFHPDYATNGRLFVDYTDKQGNTHVSELHAENGVADPASVKDLLVIDQPYSNHNGGQLQFGPDGDLYIGMGDGGAGGDPENRAQNPDQLLGKILRIDVDHPEGGKPYGIPDDNPFASGGGKPEIFATGVRNPWRFSFDRSTGDMWIGDVGQNKWEEVDFIPRGTGAGRNLGWDVLEGTHSYEDKPLTHGSDITNPVLQYSHDEGASISGGYVYRGTAIPELQGWYVYGDYASNSVRALKVEDGQVVGRKSFDVGEGGIVSFGEGPNGEMYATSINGKLFQFTPTDGSSVTQPPVRPGEVTPVDQRKPDTQYVQLGTKVGQMRFDNDEIHVKPGKVEIDFNNNDGTPHNVVVHGDGVSARLPGYPMHGESQALTFTAEAGETYDFYCEPHQAMGMKGKIVVDPA